MIDEFRDTDTARRILREYKTVAVVGISDKEDRPSFMVASYLQSRGYRIVPVNPRIKEVMGEESYPDLQSIPFPVDVVDIFRRGEDVPPIVDAAIEIGAKAVWMQEGVVNPQAASKARQGGLDVVMDLCMMKEHQEYET